MEALIVLMLLLIVVIFGLLCYSIIRLRSLDTWLEAQGKQLLELKGRITWLQQSQHWMQDRLRPESNEAATPAQQSSAASAQPAAVQPPATAQHAATQPATVAPQPTTQAAPVPQPAPQPAASWPPPTQPTPAYPPPTQPVPAHQLTAKPAATLQPSAPAASPPPPNVAAPAGQPAAATPKAPKKSMENVFGRNIVGIVASVLVFLGLIFLGILVVPYLSDELKIAGMFLLSTILAVAGYLLERRFSNNFTQALLGTGLGAFFISILVTHLYFHALSDVIAFSLLAVWTALALFVARITDSLLIGILAHAGMVASVCSGYATPLGDEQLMQLVTYQFVSTAIIVVGNMLCCKKLYRFGLIATLALLDFASLMMAFRFMWSDSMGNSGVFQTSLPDGLVIAAFLVQFLGGTFLGYLLFVSCARLKTPEAMGALQIVNLILWLPLLLINVSTLIGHLVSRSIGTSYQVGAWFLLDYSATYYTPYAWALAVTLAVLFIVCAAVVFARRRVTLPVLMEDVTVLGLVAVACLMLLSNLGLLVSSDSYHFGARSTDFDVVRLSWLVIPAVLLFVLSRIGRNSKLAYAGRALLISDAAFMLIPWIGYQELIRVGTIALAIGYLVLLAVLGWYAWTTLAKEFRAKNQQTFIFCLQLAFLGSLASVLLRADLDFGLELWLLCVICCLLVLHLLRLDKKVLWYRLQEFVVSLGIAADLANGVTNPVGKSLAVVAAIVCLLAMAERIRLASSANAKAAREKTLDPSKQGLEYLTAFCVNALFLSILYAVTTWFTQAYPFSLSCMFIALVLIALGFWSRTTPFRLYGLVVTILCVLKLVTWDIVSADSLMRVIAFIGGGLICFGISALYNFAVKRFTDAPTQNHSEPASKPDHHSAP